MPTQQAFAVATSVIIISDDRVKKVAVWTTASSVPIERKLPAPNGDE